MISKNALTTYKVKFQLLPTNIISFLRLVKTVITEQHRRALNLCRTTLKAVYMSVVGVNLWNSLLLPQRHCHSISSFTFFYESLIIASYKMF